MVVELYPLFLILTRILKRKDNNTLSDKVNEALKIN